MNKRFIVLLFIIIILLFNASISGCISSTWFRPPNPKKWPRNPSIAIDSQGNPFIAWETGRSTPHKICYIKLDSIGEKRFSIKKINGNFPKVIINQNDEIYIFQGELFYTKFDKNNNIIYKNMKIHLNNSDIFPEENNILINNRNHIQIIYRKGSEIWYLKLDGNDEIKSEDNITPIGNIAYEVESFIDQNDIIYILYLNQYNKNKQAMYDIVFVKGINNNTNFKFTKVVESQKFIDGHMQYIFGNSIIVDKDNFIYVFIEEYDGEPFLSTPIKTYYNKYFPNGSIIETKVIKPQKLVTSFIDNQNNIKIIGSKGLTIIDNKGNNETIPVKFFNQIFLNDIGSTNMDCAMDFEGNLHLVWYKINTKIWEGDRDYDEYHYYTLYYSKIDENGSLLVNQTVIDTDGDPDLQQIQKEVDLCFSIIFIAIPVTFIFLFLIYKIYHNQKKIKK
jgi:hypothetical protein